MSNAMLWLVGGLAAFAFLGGSRSKPANDGEFESVGAPSQSTGNLLQDLLAGLREARGDNEPGSMVAAQIPDVGSQSLAAEIAGILSGQLNAPADVGSMPPPDASHDEDIGVAPDPRVAVQLIGSTQDGYRLTSAQPIAIDTPILVGATARTEQFSTTPGVLADYLKLFE